jgi:hypothetical protein
MTKQRTDNLSLILLEDHDEDSFYADHVKNLGKRRDTVPGGRG